MFKVKVAAVILKTFLN